MSAPPIYRAEWKVLHEGQVYSVVATEGRTCTYDQAEEAIAFHLLHAPTGYLVNMGRGLVLHLDHLGAWPSRDEDLGTAVVQRGEETLRQVDATLDGCARPYLGPHLVKVPRTGVRGDGPGLIGNEETFVPVHDEPRLPNWTVCEGGFTFKASVTNGPDCTYAEARAAVLASLEAGSIQEGLNGPDIAVRLIPPCVNPWKPVDQATPQDVLDWDALRAPAPKPQPLDSLKCGACGERVLVHALARHAQLAHGVDPELLFRAGKGGGLWTLAAYYGQASPEVTP